MNREAEVLLYNLKDTDKGGKVKTLLKNLGISFRDVEKEEYYQPIGALMGLSGVKPQGKKYTGGGFEDEMLVMRLREKQLNQFLAGFGLLKIERVNLKAVLTETNKSWNSLQLYLELYQEHKAMNREQ